jgi:uncharacterized protein (DUF427 family)
MHGRVQEGTRTWAIPAASPEQERVLSPRPGQTIWRVELQVHRYNQGGDDVPSWMMTSLSARIVAARAQWASRGQARPPFAVMPGPGQESVWDYPRPPRLVPDPREVIVRWGEVEVARTHRALRMLETSHPPSYYLPWDDVAKSLLKPVGRASFCEWKGPARYWTLVDGDRCLEGVAWSYPDPLPGAEALAACVAFYAGVLDCRIDGAPVRPQPGGFYGGWITPDLVGPFKGEPGSQGW